MMYKLILFLSLAAPLVSAQTPPAVAPTATPTPIKLGLNWKPEPQFGGFYAAVLNQTDLKENIKLELIEGGSGMPTIQMLESGSLDFAVVSGEEILISNKRNPKATIVPQYAVFQTNPHMIMCHAEKGFKNIKQVLSSPVTLAWQSGLAYARYLQKKYPDMKAKTVPYQGGIAAFLTDSNLCQQGFVTSEALAAEKAGAKISKFLIADEGFNPYTTVLAVRKDTLEKSPALVKQVVDAVRAGWTAYLSDPASTNARMHTLNPSMSTDMFAASAAAQRPLINVDGKMVESRWQELEKEL